MIKNRFTALAILALLISLLLGVLFKEQSKKQKPVGPINVVRTVETELIAQVPSPEKRTLDGRASDNSENHEVILSFRGDEIIREGVLMHTDFQPKFIGSDFFGFEIISNSTEYSLEDFGLQYGDVIVGIGPDERVSLETFKAEVLSHMKYGSLIVEINRNNVNHYVELELDSLISDP